MNNKTLIFLVLFLKKKMFKSDCFKISRYFVCLICFQSAKDYEQLRGPDNGSSCQRMYHWRRFANDSQSANRV